MTPLNGNDTSMDAQSDAWLDDFVSLAANCMESHSLVGPIRWFFWMEDDLSHVLIYPTTVKLIGGQWDGEEVVSGFTLDIHSLISYFQRIDAISWNTQGMGPHDDEGPRISIEGTYEGHNIWLRILAEPLVDEEPGMELDVPDSED